MPLRRISSACAVLGLHGPSFQSVRHSSSASAKECPFSRLGLKPDAKIDDVRKAYKTKAKTCHPDVDGGCEKAFREVKDAYEECKSRIESGWKPPNVNNASSARPETKHPQSEPHRQQQHQQQATHETHEEANAYDHSEQHQQQPRGGGGAFYSSERGAFYGDTNFGTTGQSGFRGAYTGGNNSHANANQSGATMGDQFDEAFWARIDPTVRERLRQQFEQEMGAFRRMHGVHNRSPWHNSTEQGYAGDMNLTQDADSIRRVLYDWASRQDCPDPGQIVLAAVRRSCKVMPLCHDHVDFVFRDLIGWYETTFDKVATAPFYHQVLQTYTDFGSDRKPETLGATLICEVTERVLERMRERGLELDDWTMTLTNKAYRFHPYPSW